MIESDPRKPGVLWNVAVTTRRPLAHLPRTTQLVSERRCDPRLYHHEGRWRRAETHFLFKYTIAGVGGFRDAEGERRVPSGQGFLCEICDPSLAYFYPPDGREPWEFAFICFEWSTGRAAVREIIDRYGPIHALPSDTGVMARLLQWRHYRHSRAELDAGASAELVTDLLTALVSARESARPADSTDQLVRQAQELVRDRLSAPLTVADLAAELGVSREHLSRTFREQTGQTPYAYILRQKMLLACRLLKEGDHRIADVARQVGFSDPSHFVRRFKDHMHLPPGRFRKLGVVPLW